MKKNIFTIAILTVLLVPVVALATPAPKVTICHATSSESNPWTRIVVSENAIGGHFDNPGSPKAGHEDDVLLQGDQPCPVKETPKPEEPTPPKEEPKTPEQPKPAPAPAPVVVPESEPALTEAPLK